MGNPLKLTKCQVQGLLMLGIPLLLLGPWIGLAFYAQLYKGLDHYIVTYIFIIIIIVIIHVHPFRPAYRLLSIHAADMVAQQREMPVRVIGQAIDPNVFYIPNAMFSGGLSDS